jgi:hypothetical protein
MVVESKHYFTHGKRLFNVAMMFASRLFHAGPSICKKSPQTGGSTSTSGGFLVEPPKHRRC